MLALALVAQVTHHFRQDLVRHPQLGAPLRAAYERLGLDLLPNWDLAALELRQWGNEPDAATSGRLVVRASLTNRATFAQPHPLLRLELEDRFGNTVATRDFEPSEYLKNPVAGHAPDGARGEQRGGACCWPIPAATPSATASTSACANRPRCCAAPPGPADR